MSRHHRAAVAALVACLFLSGAGSLMLQVVWSRSLRLVFGSSTLAVSTVLVSYMLGLGFGGLWGGRLAQRLRRPVRAYGLMEIGIGLYALFVPWLLGLYPELNRLVTGALDFWAAASLRLVLVLAALIVPTWLMGATLPVLVRAVASRSGEIGSRVGLLYGVNTLGAVTGVLVATFALFPAIGLFSTNVAGAAADLVAGAVAIALLSRRLDGSPGPAAPQPAGPSPPRVSGPLVSYGLVGFSALLFEVCWTRALTLVFGSSVYAFASMLAAFLVGIALGSLLVRRWLDRLAAPLLWYVYGLVTLCLLTVATAWILPELPRMLLGVLLRFGVTGPNVIAANFVLSVAAMLGPTIVLGALFPLLVRGVSEGQSAALAVGQVYFFNTVGSALGAFAAGFLLISTIGLAGAMTAGSGLVLVAALVALVSLRAPSRRDVITAGGAVALASLATLSVPSALDTRALAGAGFLEPQPALDVGVELEPYEGVDEEDRIVFYRDGVNATVSVHEKLASIDMLINGRPEAGIDDISTELLLGHLPFLFGGNAEKALVIGFGSGVTTGAMLHHDGTSIDVVELEAAVLEASELFAHVNGRPLESERVRLIVDDGRTILSTTRSAYDVISSQPSSPWVSGTSNLFTHEFFAEARKALRPGGRLIQWLGMVAMDSDALASIVSAMREEFPHVYGFLENARATDLLLIGTDRPLTAADLPRWETLPDGVRADLGLIGLSSSADLWSLLHVTPDDASELAKRAGTANTDDSMYVELRSPWLLYASPLEPLGTLSTLPGTALDVAESTGPALGADEVGALALTTLSGRGQPAMARRLARVARERGPSPHADATEARLLALAGQSSTEQLLRSVSDAVARAPGSAALRLARAEHLRAAGRLQEALDELDLVIAARPADLRTRLLRARTAAALGRFDAARRELDGLLDSRLALLEPSLWADAAVSSAALSDFEAAASQMSRFLAASPSSEREWELLARIFSELGRTEDERRALRNAEAARKNRLLDAHREARLAAAFGATETSARILRQIVARHPDYERARRDLESLERSGSIAW